MCPSREEPHNSLTACVPHPPEHQISGWVRRVIDGDGPALGEPRPIVFHAWLVPEGRNDDGSFDSGIDMTRAFAVAIRFTGGDGLTFPDATRLRLEELTAWPGIAELVRKVGSRPTPRAVDDSRGPRRPGVTRAREAGRYLAGGMDPVCPECGAPLSPDSGACRARFHDLLALEWQIPGGPGEMAHYLSVTSYNLQHPSAFTPEARAHMLASLEGALSGELTVEDLRRSARREYDGPKRVLGQRGIAPGDPGNEPVPGWPTKWARTVLHALGAEPNRDSYHARVRQWAEAVLETMRSAPSTDG